MSTNIELTRHKINLPDIKDLVPEDKTIDQYILDSRQEIERQKNNFLRSKNTMEMAYTLAFIPSIIIFAFAWIIPLICQSQTDVLLWVGIGAGLFSSAITWITAASILDPAITNRLKYILQKVADKKFNKKTMVLDIFKLQIEGDPDLGTIELKIINQNIHKTVFSKSFTLEQETEALEAITEADNLVKETNYKIHQLASDHKIAAQGFVKRAMAYNE